MNWEAKGVDHEGEGEGSNWEAEEAKQVDWERQGTKWAKEVMS